MVLEGDVNKEAQDSERTSVRGEWGAHEDYACVWLAGAFAYGDSNTPPYEAFTRQRASMRATRAA